MFAKIAALVVALAGFGIFFKCQQQLDVIEKAINEDLSTKITILDLEPYYTAEHAQATLENMGPHGRMLYMYALEDWDTLLPIGATLMLGGLMILSLLWHRHLRMWWVVGLILLACYPALDYWENARHLEMLRRYPQVFYAGDVTGYKWLVINSLKIFIGLHFLNDLLTSGKKWAERQMQKKKEV